MFGNLQDSQSLAVKITGDSSGLQSAAGGATAALGGLKTAALGVATAVGAMGAVIGTKAVKAATEFEQAMANVEAMADATQEQMTQLTTKATSLGKETKFLITDIANAEKVLSKFGLSAQEVTDSIDGITNAAAASGNTLKDTSKSIIAVTRGFNMAVKDTQKVADTFAEAARSSGAQIMDLASGMRFIAPIANEMEMSLETVTAMLGKLADRGIEAGQAGRWLRSAFTQFAEMKVGKATEKAKKAIEKFGMSIKDVANMSLMKFVTRLKDAGATMGDFATIFTRRSSTALMVLSQLGGELGNFTDKLKESGGAAKEMAETRLDTLSGQMDVLRGSIGLLMTKIGQKFTPGLEDMTRGAKNAVNQMTALVDNTKDLDEVMGKPLATSIRVVANALKYLVLC